MLPSVPAIAFLVYLLILLPWLALRSARQLRPGSSGRAALPPQETIWINTILNQVLMFVLSWMVARAIAIPLVRITPIGAGDVVAGVLALAAYFALRDLSRRVRTDDERRQLLVFALTPQTRRQWALWSLTVVVASIAEEVAYRGVGMAILWHLIGYGPAAAAVSSLAFAVAHAPQGGKSMVIIFLGAIVMHVLVWWTGTLIVAMVVHAVYDFAAGYLISREARTWRGT
jgi:membrane protease YdiL (CAAX protease family)